MKGLEEIHSEMVADYISNTYKEAIGRLFRQRESGATILSNGSKLISSVEIEQVLTMLHHDYSDLGMTINVHKNKLHTFLKWINPFNSTIIYPVFKMAYKGTSGGTHLEGKIEMFSYNRIVDVEEHEKECVKLLIIFDILHEIRHAYQRVHKKTEYEKSHEDYIPEGNGYASQWIERDANKFAQRMMNNNKEKINEVLGIDFGWHCSWGRFTVDFL